MTRPALKLSTPITGPRIVLAICPISRTGGVSQDADGSRYSVGPSGFSRATVGLVAAAAPLNAIRVVLVASLSSPS